VNVILNETQTSTLNFMRNILENNEIAGAGSELGSAILVSLNGKTSGSCALNLSSNKFISNIGCGVSTSYGTLNNLEINASENIFSKNQALGLNVANGCTKLSLNAINNQFVENKFQGIVLNTQADIADIIISNNEISKNNESGVYLVNSIDQLNFTLENNNINGNSNPGIFLSPSSLDHLALKIENNVIENNLNRDSYSSAGIEIGNIKNLFGSFKNNFLSNALGNVDLFIGPAAGGSFCLDMEGNTSETGYRFSRDNGFSGNFNLTPCNYTLVNQGDFLGAPPTAVQSCPAALPCE